MTEPARTMTPRKKPGRAFILWVAASAVGLPQQAHACHQPSLLLDNEPRAAKTGAPKRPRLRVEEALIRKGGDPADHYAYRMLVVEGDGTLRTGDHIVVAAPIWGENCLFWMGEPDAKGVVEGYATVREQAADQSYYWLSHPLPRPTAKLESYRSHPERFIWRRVRFAAPWESAPSQ